MSEINTLPEGWIYVKIKDLFYSHTSKNHPNEQLLAVTQDKGVLPRSELEHRVVMPQSEVTSYKLVEPGDFIISLRAFQGGLELATIRGIVSPAYTVLKNKLPIHSGFYKDVFKSEEFLLKLNKAVIGIRDGKQIDMDVFFSLNIQYPPLPEQRKIAEILEIVDKALEKTDQIIEKYKRIKQGLMQDLLTRGVDENWQIRSEETHRFKDSPLGRIPEEWEVVELGNEELFKLETGGTPSTEVDAYWNGCIPWLSSGEVNKKIILDTEKKITVLGYKHSNAKYIPPYSVLIALAGQGKTRGTVAVNFIKLTTNQSVAAIIPNKVRVHYKFVFYYLENDYQKLRSISLGAGRAGLSLKVLKEYIIKLPPLLEQRRIAEILSQIDKVIEREQKYKEKLERLKRGLMEDLLSGRVRVTHLLDGKNNLNEEMMKNDER